MDKQDSVLKETMAAAKFYPVQKQTGRRTAAMTQRWILSRVCFFCSSSLWTCLSLASLRENVMPELSKMERANVYFTGF